MPNSSPHSQASSLADATAPVGANTVAGSISRTNSTSGPTASSGGGGGGVKHFKKSMIVEYERIESSGGIDGAESQSSMSSIASSSFSTTPATTSADTSAVTIAGHSRLLATSFSNIASLNKTSNRLNESCQVEEEEEEEVKFLENLKRHQPQPVSGDQKNLNLKLLI